MCLIVDSNVLVDVFLTQDADYQYIVEGLDKGHTRIVYGGKLTEEYLRAYRAFQIIRLYDQAGKAMRYADDEIKKAGDGVKPSCKSDDSHIIGLAIVSGARLLCTNDDDLIEDFKNTRLLPSPKGKIYKRPQHKKLLDDSCSYQKCIKCRT